MLPCRFGRRFGWALVVSLALHLAVGPFLRPMQPANAEPPPFVISYDPPRRIVSTPTPTPTPRPVVTPHRSPQPLPRFAPSSASATPAGRRPRIANRAPHAVAVASGAPTEPRGPAAAGSGGNGNGRTTTGSGDDTMGVAAGPEATVAPTPAPIPTPTATPKATCAKPDAAAHVIDTVVPEIPQLAREAGAVGAANVRVDLSETGAVLGVTIATSAGNRALDAAALDAARRSTYAAEIAECRPEPGSYLFRVEFDG